jgi:hypothetical protein
MRLDVLATSHSNLEFLCELSYQFLMFCQGFTLLPFAVRRSLNCASN